MKQLFIYIVIILLIASASLYAGANDSGIINDLKLIPLTDQERIWLNVHPNILLGAPTTYPPFVIKKNDNTHTGMLIDLIDVINQRLDTKIRLHIESSWSAIQEKAKVGSIDGLALGGEHFKRELFFNPTEVLFPTYFYVFARSENEFKINELKDLSGMRIGYKRAAVTIKSLLDQYPGIIPVPYEDNKSISKALLNKEIDVIIGWVSFDNWRRDVLQGTIDNVLIIVDHPINMVMHIRKDWPDLVQILNKAIAAIQLDGLPQIMDKWFIQRPNPSLKPKVQLSIEEQTWLKAHSIIRYGYDPSWAPVEYTDKNGLHKGISAAYMEEVAKRLNIKIEPVSNLTWEQSVELLGKNMLDLLPATTSTAERLDNMAFTQPYLSLPIAIFSGDDIPYIGDIASLYGRKVAVPNNYATYEWLKKDHPQLSIIPVENTEQGLNLVNSKQAYAFIGNLLTTSHYITKTGKLNIRVVGDTPYRNDLAIAVRSDWPIFTGILQKTLNSIPQSQKDAIYHEWISVRYEKSFDYSLLWKVIAGIVFIFLIFSFWNWKLSNEIKQRKLTEKKLTLAKSQYENLFRHAAEGIIVTNDKGITLSFNHTAEKLFGYTSQEIIGQNVNLLVDIKHRDKHEQYVSSYHKSGKSKIIGVGREVKGLTKHGDELELYISISKNKHEGGIQFLSIIHDLTKEKQLERRLKSSEEYYHLLADASFEAIVIHNKGVVIDVNNQLCKMFKYTREELIGKQILPLVIAPESIAITRMKIAKNSTTPYEIYCIKSNGIKFPVEVLPSHKQISGKFVRIEAIRDISKAKQQEIKLKKAKEEAEQANKAKSRFISSMSHELRTPLNAVIGYSQLLQLDGMSREAMKEYSLEILNAGKHLLDLISDILDLAHIESDLIDINLEATDLVAVLITSIRLAESLTKDINISLSLEDSKYTNYYVFVDKVRLKQVILNLLSNAIKYNNKNGSVTVSIENGDAKNLTVKITDTGSGLSEDEISVLYEPFNRLGAENSNIQGTGIGLTITRQLVEKMNGSISVDSSPGIGTSFSINLPRSPSSPGTKNHNAALNFNDTGDSTMKILYVEDAISNQKLLKAIMDTRADISLTTVSSAESAIDLIKENNPDLILLDIDLPGMNGYEFFEHIESIESYKSIPVIAITAKAMVDDIEKAKKYAFADYLTKPIIINNLFNAIEPFTK